MTTLDTDAPRTYEVGDYNDLPVVASDIIYQGAAVGDSAGYARPLVAGDRFHGFAESRCDNSSGTAGAKNVRVLRRGQIKLAVSGAVITDVGQPVYASDDATFSLSPVGGSFVGIVKRWVSSGVAVVEFGPHLRDPYARFAVRETVATAKTLDAQDSGKLFWVTHDDGVVTLPAIADGLSGCAIVNGGPDGTVLVTVSPAAADMILARDLAGVDNKDLLNTKATARRGDRVVLAHGDADGYIAVELHGTWAKEA